MDFLGRADYLTACVLPAAHAGPVRAWGASTGFRDDRRDATGDEVFGALRDGIARSIGAKVS